MKHLHQFFLERAAATPDREALVGGDLRWTYAELADRARRLAGTLQRLGVGPEVPVGICTRRTPEMVAGMLGALAAGGAYLPLDPRYPRERLRFMLEDAAAPVVLTDAESAGALPETGARTLCLDRPEVWTGEPGTGGPADADSLAYLIYTSGSTGRPKGVAIPHGAAAHLMLWARDAFPPEDLTGVLACTSICFDLSVFEIFVPLAWGGRVILADNALALPALPAAGEVTLVNTVPSAAAELVRNGDFPPSVRTVNLAGEALQRALVDQLYRDTSAKGVFNLYGPSEDTTYSTWTRVPRDGTSAPTIGVPLPDETGHVLGPDLSPVPDGDEGELYLDGPALARGYLGRPDLTAERFLPNPFSNRPGARMYRTGDLVRRRPDGELDFLGRIDHQVKIRGFRIELGEVEAALLSLPGMAECVAVARKEETGSRLVAYAAPESLSASDLRVALKERLPEHMVPSAIVLLPALPRTPNGKVDRNALPAPVRVRPAVGSYVAPRHEMEERLAEIWAEALGLETVGVEDDFFELGGHSLIAGRLFSRIRQAFGADLSMRDLFATPTVAGFAARLREAGGGRAAAIAGAAGPGEPPLSFGQERLLFLQRMEAEPITYNVPILGTLSGPLDVDALRRAFTEIVRRHEPLRTVFASKDGHEVQVVLPAGDFPLPVHEVTPEEAERRAWEEFRRPLDLDQGPLLRATLLRLGAREHRLLLTVHHIAWDDGSLAVLLRELPALYRGEALPPLPARYADFAAWQRARFQGAELEERLGRWASRFQDLPQPVELPADRPRPAVLSPRGGEWRFEVPEQPARALRSLAKRDGATLFMTALALFQGWLLRLTGHPDLAVLAPVSTRNRVELEPLVGFFVNNLFVRTDLGGDPAFTELVGRVREAALAAFEDQELPFDLALRRLHPGSPAAVQALLRVIFALFQEVPRTDLSPELGMTLREVGNGTAKADLAFFLEDRADGGLGVRMEYAADLFEATTVRRLGGYFLTLFEGVAADPERRLSDLPILTEGERAQILRDWNDTAVPYPREACIHELIEEHARRAPEALALRFVGGEMTYAELSSRADALAAVLVAEGVGPDTLVGLCLERSPEAIVGIVAILKAGGAFAPLDPAYPQDRLAFMLADTAAPVLITRRGLLERLPANGAKVICWEDLSLDGAGGRERGYGINPENLAYVMYTSGSTGRPKGVAVTHRDVVRLARSSRFAEFGSDHVFLHLGPLSFDATTLEVGYSLLNGSALAIMPPETPSLEELGRFLVDSGVTAAWITAGLFQQMAESQLENLAKLRLILSGGDVLSPAHVARVLEAAPGITMVNGYGPTESTVFTSCHPLHSPSEVESPLPIGRPIGNTRVAVVDRDFQLVPPGVEGELWVGGDGLARGYLHRPELTAARFVPDPFWGTGERLYRTGDLARWRPDGLLEFLGRVDFQVKLRGFRIELEEIEAALASHQGVSAASVVVQGEGGDKRLVAFWTGEAPGPDFRSFLGGRLPGYMVPAAFVRLDALPLNAHGKVDRKALAGIEPVLAAAAKTEAPRNPTERALAGIFGEILGVEPVGIHEDFFEIGGHSLLGTRVMSRIRTAFGVELPLRTLFERSTVAALAEVLDRSEARGAEDRIPRRTAPADRFPVSFSQLRLWLLDRLEPGTPAYNIPFPLRLDGPLDRHALERSLAGIVRRHEGLRTVFAYESGEPVQIVVPGGELPMPLIDLSGLPEAERDREARRVADRESWRGFDLSRWPLLRASLVRREPERHDLLFVVHHAVADGWSLGMLFSELGTLYEAFSAGLPSPLPELPIQYPDFAVWQRRRLQGAQLDALLGYWLDRLAGAGNVLDLPTDRKRPAALTYRGGHENTRLPRTVVEGLRRREGRGRTTFMLLLAAAETLLARWSGQGDFCVGTFIANRNRAEIERLIGFFVNTLILRADLGATPTFDRLLDLVKEDTLGAYTHQDLPLERLLEALQPKRDPSRTPVFQVMLNLLNVPEPPRRFGGLTMSRLAVDPQRSNFDLTFWFQPDEHGLEFDVEYSTDLFDRATIRRLQDQFVRLLEAALADPETPLGRLPLLGEEERRQLIFEWNRTAADTQADVPVHALFAAQARRVPDRPAVVFGNVTLTYAELDRRSSALARTLRRRGVGPETVVGVALRRSPEMIVALLAVLKSGGAYLPLDPDYPRERLDFMIEDAGVKLVIDGPLPEEPGEVELPGPDPASLAYIIYTSGSTGRPKGVMMTHGSLSNHTASAVAGYEIRDSDRILQFASLSFDTSAEEIYPCLAAGATLVLRDDSMLTSAGQFLAAAERLGITVLNFPTAYWHELAAGLERDGIALPRAVRMMIVGGERLLADRIESWFRSLASQESGVRLMNSYGPTEGTIVTTRTEVEAGRLAPSGDPFIGRPIHNVRVYVLDREGEPAPIGVPGELYVGGLGVARGYLRRPDLTADRFLPDPFGEPGVRLYRTGDRVRWLAGGDLEFLGRMDHQVKVRGFRVEIGEVEEALRRLPGIRDAVVDARPDAAGTNRLVAWVVPEDGALPDLRARLKDRLPDYMVPSAVVPLSALPRTPSNKIDRRALPEPEPAPLEAAAGTEPQSGLERTIAGIWQKILGVGRVGLHDNFFDLGGHSLLLVQAHGLLRQALGRDLDIMILFQRPTVSTLARELSKEDERPSFTQAQEMARRQRQVNTGRKQLMEKLMQQKKGR